MVITGVIQTIRKHIVSEQALAGGDKGVGIEESAPSRVVITGLEIIEPGLWDRLVAINHIFSKAWIVSAIHAWLEKYSIINYLPD